MPEIFKRIFLPDFRGEVQIEINQGKLPQDLDSKSLSINIFDHFPILSLFQTVQ